MKKTIIVSSILLGLIFLTVLTITKITSNDYNKAENSVVIFLCQGDIFQRFSKALSQAGVNSLNNQSSMADYRAAVDKMTQALATFKPEIIASPILKSNQSGLEKLANGDKIQQQKDVNSIGSKIQSECPDKVANPITEGMLIGLVVGVFKK